MQEEEAKSSKKGKRGFLPFLLPSLHENFGHI
jgi:hypothetical protein